ncbi:MAG: hypothetical protein CL815_03345, partial [Coraliomargarita sp.]|nr:hypothetical protein [Coraliomargarita sp.]
MIANYLKYISVIFAFFGVGASSFLYAQVLPTVDITSPASGSELLLGDPLLIQINASDAGGIAAIRVFNNNNYEQRTTTVGGVEVTQNERVPVLLGIATSTGIPDDYQFSFIPANIGILELEARAINLAGNGSPSSPVTVSVTRGLAPSIAIDAPLTGTTVYRGSELVVYITASDLDGIINQVEVYNGSQPLGIAELYATNNYRFIYNTNQAGPLLLTAVATDDRGNVSTSALTTVNVITGEVPTVAISSPIDKASYEANDAIIIDVIAEDIDGFVVKVDVTMTNQYNGDSTTGTASKVGAKTWRLVVPTTLSDVGLMELTARATDERGNSSISDSLEFSVTTGDVPTVAIISPVDDPLTLDDDETIFTAGD